MVDGDGVMRTSVTYLGRGDAWWLAEPTNEACGIGHTAHLACCSDAKTKHQENIKK